MEIRRPGDQPCILVEVPRSGIAEFYGNWLLAASKAEAFWKHAYGEPEFARKVDRLTVVHFPDFGLAGCGLLMRLNHRFASFIFNFNEDGSNLARLPSCCAGLIERYPLNSFAIQHR